MEQIPLVSPPALSGTKPTPSCRRSCHLLGKCHMSPLLAPAPGIIPQLQGREIPDRTKSWWILCTHVSIQSPFVVPELVGKDLQRPHDLVHLEQQVHVLLLVNPWKRRGFVSSGALWFEIIGWEGEKPPQGFSGHQSWHWDALETQPGILKIFSI